MRYRLTGILNSIDDKYIMLGCSDESIKKLKTLTTINERRVSDDEKKKYRNPVRLDIKAVKILTKTGLDCEGMVGHRVTVMCIPSRYNFAVNKHVKDSEMVRGWALRICSIRASY
jgi:hypothetical protein